MSNWKEAPQDDRRVDPRVLLRLARWALPFRGLVLGSIAILVALSLIELVGPMLVRMAVDGPIADSGRRVAEGLPAEADAVRAFLYILGFYLLLVILDFGCQYLQSWITVLTGQRVMYSLRQDLFAHLQKMGLSFYDRNPVGTLVTRVTSDIESLTEMFSSGVAAIFHNLAKALLILVILFFINTKLALFTLAFVPPLVIGTWIFARAARLAFRKMRGALSHTTAFLQESVSGVRVTQLFRAERSMESEFKARNDELCKAHIGTVWVYSLMFPFVTVISAAGVAGVLHFGADEAAAGRLKLGELLQFWFYLNYFFDPVRELSERWNVLQSAAASAERIFGVLDTKPSVEDAPDAAKVGRIDGRIEFENVTFSYRPGQPVIENLSFSVEPGQRIAIVGATGGGKTTIISLLSRFYDVDSGTIRVDGRDIRTMPQRELRAQIGVVLQDVFLFHGTIAENIALGNPEITRERVRAAAAAVHADTFIERLAGGYDAEVKERGANFSAGERQLLAFARAFAANPRILVLDEATASIDSRTEELIQDALHQLLAGRTSVVIAHRLSTIRESDRILVMHKGRLRESGTHEELMAAAGIYKRLHQLQFESAGDSP